MPAQRRARQGFTLVVVLSLMILLTVVAVGLLGLAAISLRGSQQSQAMATARSHARLALMMAIGDLQTSLGPDRAISANAEILNASPGKPRLTGAWESWWDFDPSAGAPKYAEEKKKRFRQWLVSSPEPRNAENLDFANAQWSGRTVELVGAKSLGDKARPQDKVLAGRVPVAAGRSPVGAYAWHVADEAVKARINLYRDPSRNTSLADKRALVANHRPNPSVLASPSGEPLTCLPGDGTAAEYQKADATRSKVIDLQQTDLLEDAMGKVKPLRHDVTPYSLGVLCDVRRGALKQDLSSVFEMNTSLPPEFSNKTLYASTHGITGVSDPNWSILAGYYNSFRSITGKDTNPTSTLAPGAGYPMDGTTPATSFYPGPVIVKVEVLYTYVTRDSHSNWVNSLKNVNPDLLYMGHMIYTPLVTLHNPYNINISFESLEVIIRNVPIAFRIYVNDRPQMSCMVPATEMYVNAGDRSEKSFAVNIGNWPSSTAGNVSGPVTMKPGQTLVCGPYIDPSLAFGGGNGSSFFDYRNNLTGYRVNADGSTVVVPLKAKPGFAGPAVGFDADWLTPTHSVEPLGDLRSDPADSTDNGMGILGLRAADRLALEYCVKQPTRGLNTAFEVTAKLTAQGKTIPYGGLSFRYHDSSTLDALFKNRVYRYPATGSIGAMEAYVSNSTPLSDHALAKPIALFSAYARTTNGGVYETGKRTMTNGSLNVLKDGRLAGKPFLFHNPARPVVRVDLKKEKPGAHSHELNMQPLPGNADDVFEMDSTNRSRYLTGHTSKGLKSGSYLELPSGPLQAIADFRRSNVLASGYLPDFVQPIGNSQVSPLMATDRVKQSDAAIASHELLDQSWLANHALYDRFYFSTFATRGTTTPDVVFSDFMTGKQPLALQAYQSYLPAGKTVEAAKGDMFAAGKPQATAYQRAAEYQLIQGPFNVNSTSVEAWKAMLATLKNAAVTTLWPKNGKLETLNPAAGAPVPGMSLPNGGPVGKNIDPKNIDDAKTNEWNGYRELTDEQLDTLANKIVEQVRSRGPFLSLSEFVNRRIGADSPETRGGALEQALAESGVNDNAFAAVVTPITSADLQDPTLYLFKTPLAATGNPAAGAPGWIGQGELLKLLEPAATVRADTFVVRVCGEAWDPAGKVVARAYAEAIVQRVPAYIDAADRPSVDVNRDAKASRSNKKFGRRFDVVSFRWLTAAEI